MTVQGMSPAEVLGMPDAERRWWAERCEEYQDSLREK